MKYTKLPLDYPEIISLLKERGLIIEDDNKAKNYLKVISYFRLANYFHPMERDKTLHLFKPDSYFENAVDLYEFDSELRSLTFSAIQAVEIALRTKMIHHISLKYGAFWFMDKNLFSNEAIFQKCQSHIQEELKRTKEEFILEHYKKYSDPDMPPVWKTLEVITFGTLSKLYCNIKDNSIKKKIAKEFYLPQHIILENWIKCAVVLRNYLAHHARLWNRNFPIIPQTSKPFRKKWLNHQIPVTNKLYPSLQSAILPQQHQGRQLLQGTPKSVDSQSSQRGHCRNGLPCRLGERAAVGRLCKRTCTSLTSIKSYLSSTLMIVSHASEEFEKFLGSWQEGA